MDIKTRVRECPDRTFLCVNPEQHRMIYLITPDHTLMVQDPHEQP